MIGINQSIEIEHSQIQSDYDSKLQMNTGYEDLVK